MNANYSLLFYLKKPRNYVSGPKFVYLRITVGGIPKEISTGQYCEPSRWNTHANRARGTTEEIKKLNAYLDSCERKIGNLHLQLEREDVQITADLLKQKYLGKDIDHHFLLAEFTDHNRKMEALLGKGFRKNTLKGYATTLNHLSLYVEQSYKTADINIKSVDHAFIVGWEFYLRSEKNCTPVTTAKYMKHLRKIINLCLDHKWIIENPFKSYRTKAKPKEKEFLTDDELERIQQKHFEIPRLAQVRDIFVFCCYTGLSYCDVKLLNPGDIAKGVDGKLWILTDRLKTGTNTNIPLLPNALKIIERYSDYAPSVAKGLVLPVLSNQKMNSYLKEIADVCNITKVLTFHKARHTFATTVTLSNNVPIETVSKMLGHTSIKTTQHYAKLLDNRVATDMDLLQHKLQVKLDQPNSKSSHL